MIACYIIKPGVLELREVPVPEPSNGELLVKINAALTCGTDLKAFERGHSLIPMPGPFGHEFSGTITKTGKGVDKFKEGDEIMAVHTAPCLKCKYCAKKAFNLCENLMTSKILGVYAEYILLPQHIVKQNVYHKPTAISFAEAALLEPLSCVVHGLKNLDLKDSASLIIGTGPIGLLHLLLAKQSGAKVAITGLEQERLQIAEKMGADMIVSPTSIDKAIESFTEGIGVDFVFECTGQLDVWERSINYVRRGGTIILFGGCKKDTIVTYDTYRLHYDEITIKGSFHFTPDDVEAAWRLLSGNLYISHIITASYPLKDIKIPFERLAKGEGLKYAIIP